MMSSASFGLPASPSSSALRLSRRMTSSLSSPLLTSVERTLSVLRGDFVERMRESVAPELEDAMAAHHLQRRLSRGGSSSTSQTIGDVIGPRSPTVRRKKSRKWRKRAAEGGARKVASSASLSRSRGTIKDENEGNEHSESAQHEEDEECEEEEEYEDEEDGEDEDDEVKRQGGRRRAQSFLGEETDDWDDSMDDDGRMQQQVRETMRRAKAKPNRNIKNEESDASFTISSPNPDPDLGFLGASRASDTRDPSSSVRLFTSSSLGSSTAGDDATMLASTVQPQQLSLSSSSAVPTRPYRSPLLEQHDKMLQEWKEVKLNLAAGRGDGGGGGAGKDGDDQDDDLEAGLPLLPRKKQRKRKKTNANANNYDGGGVGGDDGEEDDGAMMSGGGNYTYGGVEMEEDYDEAVTFLKDLCEALHLFGAPAHRIEYNMMRASDGLGIVAAYAVFPELCILSFGPQDERKAETYLYRKNQGGLNCAKLRWCDDLATKVANREIGLKEAGMELYIIGQLGPVYPLWVKLLMYGLASMAVCAVFFHGGWLEMFVSLVLGTGVGVVSLIGTRYESVERMLEAIVSIAAAFLARLFVQYVYPACWGAISLSTIVWMLPGLSLTVGVNELAERKMISGTVRVFFAMLIALELGFGLAIGSLLVFWEDEAEFLQRAGDHLCDGTNGWVMLAFFFVICITFNGLQEALPNQWPMMTFTAALSYGLSFLGGLAGLRPQICTTVSAFATGVVGNLHARLTGHTATIPINAGILVLVPGSVGVRGVKALMENDIVSGIQFGFSMLTIALSIIVGLFVANMIFPLRKIPTPTS